MELHIILIAFKILLASGSSTNVRQTPSEMFAEMGHSSTIQCSHSIQDYNRILWYKQLKGSSQLHLLGYMNVKDSYPEKGVDVEMKGSALKGETCELTIRSNTESAKYFCAASKHNQYEAYFGDGTKLTVLEKDHVVTPPTVKIFKPSEKERPRKKGDPKFKTLVCVARGFYPDHVEVSWKVNGEPVKKGVSTDSVAQRIGKNYTISSRLLVDAAEWTNPGNCFSCLVSFFDGTSKETYSDEACGIEDENVEEEDGLSRERYLRITQNAKLSYVVFIVKSAVYGLFVAFLVWKIQRTTVKHT